MIIQIRRFFAFFICFIGVLLPHRLRIYYSELLGWVVQFVYMNYIYTLKFIIKNLNENEPVKR